MAIKIVQHQHITQSRMHHLELVKKEGKNAFATETAAGSEQQDEKENKQRQLRRLNDGTMLSDNVVSALYSQTGCTQFCCSSIQSRNESEPNECHCFNTIQQNES